MTFGRVFLPAASLEGRNHKRRGRLPDAGRTKQVTVEILRSPQSNQQNLQRVALSPGQPPHRLQNRQLVGYESFRRVDVDVIEATGFVSDR